MAAMTACRRVWFVGMRAQEKIVPSTNPFTKMDLKSCATGQAPRPKAGLIITDAGITTPDAVLDAMRVKRPVQD